MIISSFWILKIKRVFTTHTTDFLFLNRYLYRKAVTETLLSFANSYGKHALALCFLSIANCFQRQPVVT